MRGKIFTIILLLSVFCLTNAMSYFLGSNNKDIFIAHAVTHTKIMTISELTDKLGYSSNGNPKEDMKIIKNYDIKDMRYYVVEVNGVKTLASHKM